MAAANITINITRGSYVALGEALARYLWEERWQLLTGVSWQASRGKPRQAALDVTLGKMPHDSHVRIRGTALEVPCRKAEVIHDVGDVGVLRLEIPMTGDNVTVRTA